MGGYRTVCLPSLNESIGFWVCAGLVLDGGYTDLDRTTLITSTASTTSSYTQAIRPGDSVHPHVTHTGEVRQSCTRDWSLRSVDPLPCRIVEHSANTKGSE